MGRGCGTGRLDTYGEKMENSIRHKHLLLLWKNSITAACGGSFSFSHFPLPDPSPTGSQCQLLLSCHFMSRAWALMASSGHGHVPGLWMRLWYFAAVAETDFVSRHGGGCCTSGCWLSPAAGTHTRHIGNVVLLAPRRPLCTRKNVYNFAFL